MKAIARTLLLASVALALNLGITVSAGAAYTEQGAQPDGWRTYRAYDVRTAYWVNGQPHYGAFFSGSNGWNQHWRGSGGDARTCSSSAGCISNWNWWGNSRNVLLLPKAGWLFGGPSGVWTPNNYEATLYF